MYIKAKILHRDINPENLMVKADADGTYHPFLIDFDFAKHMDEDVSKDIDKDVSMDMGKDASKDEDTSMDTDEDVSTDTAEDASKDTDKDASKDTDEDASQAHIHSHRTMSTPFLAVDLLSDPPPPPLYRHDLESFVWCLWWIAVSYLNGEQIQTEELEGWYEKKWSTIRRDKLSMMAPGDARNASLTENMKDARPILERFALLFQDAFRLIAEVAIASPQEKKGFDLESVGGLLTWESFQACL